MGKSTLNVISKWLTLLGFFLYAVSSFAINGKTTYQAKIIKPDGYPLQSASVNFRFTVLDQSGSCILYSEDYSAINMTDTAGLISFPLGSGTRSFPTSGTSQTFQNTFDNSIASFACQNIGIYNPNPTDSRKIVMQFNDGAGWQTLPAMSMNAVPYAMFATKAVNSQSLNGKADSSFVEYATLNGLSCAADQAIKYNGVSFSCLSVGASATVVTSSTVITALGYEPALGTSFTALDSTISSVSSTVYSVSSTVANLNNVVTSLSSSVAASLSAITSSQWSTSGSNIYFDSNKVSIGTSATPSVSYSLLVSGGIQVLGGDGIAIPSNNVNALFRQSQSNYWPASNTGFEFSTASGATRKFYFYNRSVSGAIQVLVDGAIGVGTLNPVTKLDVSGGLRISMETGTCNASLAGTIRYNTGSLEYCNGTSWSTLGVAGSGITSFNSSTSGTQILATGITGTIFNITSENGVHTFNLPLAASSSVMAGLLSNADYVAFSNKANVASLTSVASDLSSVSSGLTVANSNISAVSSVVATKIASSATSINEVLGYVPVSATSLGNYLFKANNLSDLSSVVSARSNLGLGSFATASSLDLGSASATGTIAEARLPNSANVTSGTQYTKLTVDGKGRVTSGAQLSVSDVTSALGYTPASASASTQWTTSGTNIFYNTGNVGIGTIAPSALLHLAAGTSVTASLRLTSGTLLASPQSGTIEFDGANFYVTDGANSRKSILVDTGGNFSVNNITSPGNLIFTPNSSLIVSSTTASTNSTTGSLVLKGGLGVAGNIYAAGIINATAFRANQGAPDAADSSTNGFAFGSDGDTGMFSPGPLSAANGIIAFYNNNAETMRIHPGAVGIGTSTPAALLHLQSNSQFSERVRLTGQEFYQAANGVASEGVSLLLGVNRSGNRQLWIADSAQLTPNASNTLIRINPNSRDISSLGTDGITSKSLSLNIAGGFVGIGNGSPGAPLTVGNGATTRGFVQLRDDGTNPPVLQLSNGMSGGRNYNIYSGYTSSGTFDIADGSAGNVSRLTIASSGNVGIGTTSPLAKLDVSIFNQDVLFGSTGGNNTAVIKSSGGSIGMYSGGYTSLATTGDMVFQTSGTVGGGVVPSGSEKMRITSSGNVGIGITSPDYKLTVPSGISVGDAIAGNSNISLTPLINSYLGSSGDVGAGSTVWILLAYNQSAASGISASGFDGQIYTYRGSAGSWNNASTFDVAVKTAYNGPGVYRFNTSGPQSAAQIVTLMYAGTSYVALQIPQGSSQDIYLTGRFWAFKPILLDSVNHAGVVTAVTAISNPFINSAVAANGFAASVGINTTSPQATLDVSGTIKYGYTRTLTNSSGVTFTGLNGNVDGTYEITITGKIFSGGANKSIRLGPNGSFTAAGFKNLSHRFYDANGTTTSDTNARNTGGFTAGFSDWNADGDIIATTRLMAKAGRVRLLNGSHTFVPNVATLPNYIMQVTLAGSWTDTTTNITSLAIDFEGGTFTGEIVIRTIQP